MKKLFSLLFISIFITFSFSQQNEDDINSLSIFSEYAKAKNYDAAYTPWMELRKRNPKFNSAIYTYGERILKYKIKNSTAEEKVQFINDLVLLWSEKRENFSKKAPLGATLAKTAQLQYDNRSILNIPNIELYNSFDIAYKSDLKTFNNPKNLYTYFKLTVELYDSGEKAVEELFTKYDEVSEKIELEIKNFTNKLNQFIPENEDQQQVLSKKQKSQFKSYTSFLKAYTQISKGMDIDLGERGNCENLIKMYDKNYEANKNEGIWLQRAMNRLANKDCIDTELFVTILQQKNNLEPNPDTSYYLGIIKDKEGKSDEAFAYYTQAIDLETDGYEKAKILFKIATKFKKSGSFSKARSYYRKALRYNPSMGKCYIAISQMYASSAKNCGSDNFTQRAVYWLASSEALKAAKVDNNLKKSANSSSKNYLAKAPQKSEIFSSGREGELISIGCWISSSVKVPNL
ncbi:MAG: tetratricopeptide (TPR) repeat protein [Flavobacteriaceae bacterium]|jgi:tetratricopeptide (TPR) repeat protein|tara:strand:+ start:1760 stop:3139 length:1380 start_codon:yes stop_codon:yes gene_type:complete